MADRLLDRLGSPAAVTALEALLTHINREGHMKQISFWLTATVVLSLATGGVAEEILDQIRLRHRHVKSADGRVEAPGTAAGGVMMGEEFLDRFQTTITLRRNADGSVTQHCESAQESDDEN